MSENNAERKKLLNLIGLGVLALLVLVFSGIAMARCDDRSEAYKRQLPSAVPPAPSAQPEASVEEAGVKQGFNPELYAPVDDLNLIEGKYYGGKGANPSMPWAQIGSRKNAKDRNIRYGSPWPWRLILSPWAHSGEVPKKIWGPINCGFYPRLHMKPPEDNLGWRTGHCNGGEEWNPKEARHTKRVVIIRKKDDKNSIIVQVGNEYQVELVRRSPTSKKDGG